MRSAPSSCVSVRSAPAKSAPTSVQLWSDADRNRAPAKKTPEKSRKSSSQCSKIAPGAEAPSNFALRSVGAGEVRAGQGRAARGRRGSGRRACRSLPERSLPARSAPVRSGVTLGFWARQSFHSGDRSDAASARDWPCAAIVTGRRRAKARYNRTQMSTASTPLVAAPSEGDGADPQGPARRPPAPLRADVGGGARRAAGAAPGQDLLRRARLRTASGRSSTVSSWTARRCPNTQDPARALEAILAARARASTC